MITIVGLGPGDPGSVPAAALGALSGVTRVCVIGLEAETRAMLGSNTVPICGADDVRDGDTVAAPDPEALRLARAFPDANTVPDRDRLRDRAIGAQVAYLAQVGAHLRRECPWDREQNAKTIVPHTIEEAYEVADAIAGGDPAHQRDELGDLLFQTVFLSQLLEESGDGDLGEVAAGQAQKLISRHPHVYGDAVAREASAVVDLWEVQKRAERPDQGIFHDLPPGLPSIAYASKAQKRAAAIGFTFGGIEDALDALTEELLELREEPNAHELGDVLFAAVAVARQARVDPDLALRATAGRFRERVEQAALLAKHDGRDFTELPPDVQLGYYAQARLAENDR